MKDRNIICKYYIRHGECSKNKKADLKNICQHCSLYIKKENSKPFRVNNKKKKLEKIKKKEGI